MTFQFFCINCGAKLQVEDIHQGQQIQCPGCQAIQNVPKQHLSETVSTTTDNTPYQQSYPQFDNVSNNPYQTPQTVTGDIHAEEFGLRFSKVQFTPLIRNTMVFCFRYIKEFLTAGGIYFFFGVIGALSILLMGISGDNVFSTNRSFLLLFFYFISIIASYLIGIVFVKYFVNLQKGGDRSILKNIPSFRDFAVGFLGNIFYAFCIFLIYLVFIIIVVLCIGLYSSNDTMRSPGMTILMVCSGVTLFVLGLCVVIKALLGRSFFLFFIIDRKKGPWESLGYSVRYSKGNLLTFFLAFLSIYLPVSFLLTLVTVPLTLFNDAGNNGLLRFVLLVIQSFIFSFVFAPLFLSLFTTMYLQMTGQPTIFEGMLSHHMPDPVWKKRRYTPGAENYANNNNNNNNTGSDSNLSGNNTSNGSVNSQVGKDTVVGSNVDSKSNVDSENSFDVKSCLDLKWEKDRTDN